MNLLEYEELARDRMDASAYDYYAGGAGDECTLAANRRAFQRIVLRPRLLVDVSRVDPSTSVLGEKIAVPVLLAPTAFNRLARPDGELAAARAAGGAQTVMVVSTVSTFTIEDIAAASTGPLWFQLYVYKDRGLTRDLVVRATTAGYRALVLTVDSPWLGRRERDVRNQFTLPPGMTIANFETAQGRAAQATGWGEGSYSDFATYVRNLFDPSLTWDVIGWLRSITSLPILVKGILTPEDASLALQAGASGIIVSNHGGRQLDGVEPSVAVLPRVMDAVRGEVEVLMDGGVRRGTDVLKALALGARAVLIGRPYLWGLAADGEAGVRRVLELLRAELELAMALSGRPTIASIDRSLVHLDAAPSDGE
ncbi:MAG TPA: alpha-hydroxy acid oxidase [Gemmatimonadales bacterium]|nr:alpha-hydroxy acid oxidase [Gemmatimonadales bacterium]